MAGMKLERDAQSFAESLVRMLYERDMKIIRMVVEKVNEALASGHGEHVLRVECVQPPLIVNVKMPAAPEYDIVPVRDPKTGLATKFVRVPKET